MSSEPQTMQNITATAAQNATETVIDMMAAIDKGQFVHSIEHSLREVVLACEDTQKAGTLTITVVLKPDKGSGAMFVSGGVKTKIPQRDAKSSIFFPNSDGSLSRHDQRQPDMFVTPK